MPTPVIQFGALTGWRVQSEVLPLTWDGVDFQAGIVRLEPGTTKNREGRIFPFSVLPPLETLLMNQLKRTREVERARDRILPWVFHRNGAPIRDIRGAWRTACKKAGLEGAWIHDLRRTAVRNLERAGVPRSTAMKLTGHKTESVYLRYAIVEEEMLREGVGKLASFLEVGGGSRRVVPFSSS